MALLGCRPGEAPSTVAPTTEIDTPASDAPARAQSEADEEHDDADGFVVTIASHCRHPWRAKLVAGDNKDDADRRKGNGWEPGGLEVRHDTNHDLLVQRGDSLLLTDSSGGMMMLRFDKLVAGYAALVEVTPECTGVHQKFVPATSSR